MAVKRLMRTLISCTAENASHVRYRECSVSYLTLVSGSVSTVERKAGSRERVWAVFQGDQRRRVQ